MARTRKFGPATPFRVRLLVVTAVLCFGAHVAAAQDSALTVDQVKAAFLYNFIKYTHWPEPSDSAPVLHLCAVDADAIGEELQRSVHGKASGGRAIQVVVLGENANANDCELLFLGGASRKRTHHAPNAGFAIAVLTVGEDPEFLASGGLIRFVVEGNRVRFDINVAAAAKANIRFDSRLLALARSRIEEAR